MRKFFKNVVIIGFCVMFCQLLIADENTQTKDDWYDYHWGRGITFPAANLNVGGYFKADYSLYEFATDALSLKDLSLFITWTPHARLRFFTEIEQHDWLNNHDGAKSFEEALNVERLYVDYLATESFSVRFGKFLTPFGRWNLIHSAPLVWTSNRPIITSDLFSFALRANGLMFNYTHIINEHNLDISLYFDNSNNLEPKTFNNVIFDKAAGLRLNYELTEEFQLGASFLAYQKLADADLPMHYMGGVDFLWQHQGYELMMEALYHVRQDNDPSMRLEEKGLYMQGVVPLFARLYGVGRYEYFNTNAYSFNPEHETHVGVAGMAWRPYVPLVFKTEYRFGDNNFIIAPSGFFASVAMFF